MLAQCRGVCGVTYHLIGEGAVTPCETAHQLRRQLRMALGHMLLETCYVPTWNSPAGEKGGRRPGRSHIRKPRRQLLDRLFGEAAIGGYLAAEHREHRRVALIVVETQYVIAGNGRGICRA